MKRTRFILVLVLFMALSCAKQKDPYAPLTETVINLDEVEKTVETVEIPLKLIYDNRWYDKDLDNKEKFIPFIRNLLEGPDSTLYIFDFMNSRLVQLTHDGQYIRSIGGPGSGPGEFIYPNEIHVIINDHFISYC